MNPEELNHARGLALAHGTSESDAALFAEYYLSELAGYRKIADEIEPATPEESALESALEFLGKFRQQREAGHSESWSRAYAASYEEGESAEEEAYAALRITDKRRGADGTIYQEAYQARLHQGHSPEYAAAYAGFVAADLFVNAEKYITAYARAREEGHSELYADEYAQLICEDYNPGAAAMEAGFYEQSLAGGQPERHARMYAEKLSEALYARGVTPAERVFHTLRVEGYVSGHRHAEENRLKEANAFAEKTSAAYLNAMAEFDEEVQLPAFEHRQPALKQALEKTVEQWKLRP